jgi:hypothetical protein
VSSISIDGQLREAAVAELTALECKKTGIVNLAPSQVLVQHQIEQFISHFMTNTFISPFNTLTTNIKSFYSNPGLLVPEADAMSIVLRRRARAIKANYLFNTLVRHCALCEYFLTHW